MNKQEIIGKLESVTGIKFSKEQLDILNSTGGLRIISGAGAGKTSILTSLLFVKLMCGELPLRKVLCCTFSKSGSEEMKSKFEKLCSAMGVSYIVDFRTLHSMYYSILLELGYKLNVISSSLKYIRQALSETGVTESIDLDMEEYVANLISYQVNTAVSDSELEKCTIFDRTYLTLKEFISVRDTVAKLKEKDGVVDFDDMQKQVYMLLYGYGCKYRDLVLKYCRNNWEYYFIDEFQDTGMIQYKILNALVPQNSSNKLNIIGDDDQSIYTWRGTNPRIILEDAVIDYNLDTKIIPINYRCKSSIVDFASKSIVKNTKRKDKNLQAFEKGGEVNVCNLANYKWYTITKGCYDYIMDLVSNGTDLKDIAVLCRNNNQVQLLNLMLYLKGIYTKHTLGMRFSESKMYKDCKSSLMFVNNTKNSSYIRKHLYQVISCYGKAVPNVVANIMERYDCGYIDAMESLLSYSYPSIKAENKLGFDEYNSYLDTIGRARDGFMDSAYDYVTLYREAETPEERYSNIITQISINLDFAYKGDNYRRFIGFIDFFKHLVDEHTVEEIRCMLENAEKLECSTDDFAVSKVTLSTVHSSKGLEWKNVCLFGCDNMVFPAQKALTRMYESKGYSDEDLENFIECERRLYYVGCTRAKDNLYVVGDMLNPSYFLLESMGEPINARLIKISIMRDENILSVMKDKAGGTNGKQ
jgi:DNA helicase-2/ATP-dependent DNA helicase PcrA